MLMGLPPDVTQRPVFVMAPGPPTYFKGDDPVTDPILDPAGRPLDPEVRLVPGAVNEVSGVTCSVGVTDASSAEVTTSQLDPVGFFRAAKAEVTLLDEEYQQVRGCKGLRYAGNTYTYGYTSQALGMFDVGVFTLTFFAMDQG